MKRSKLNGSPLRINPHMVSGRDLYEVPATQEKTVGNPRRITVPSEKKPRVSIEFQGDIASVVFESGPATQELEDYGFDEFICVLEGKLILTPVGGSPVEIEAGEHVILPKGFTGTWEMVGETFRELVVAEYKSWLADNNTP